MRHTTILLNRQSLHNIAPRAIAVFLGTLLACSFFVFLTIRNSTRVERLALERVILEKTAGINDVISRFLYKTQILETLVVREGRDFRLDFRTVADVIVDDPAILNILLAPGGVVTEVYPLEGNEGVLGLDFFSDAAGNREAIDAYERGDLLLGGPFALRQGGQGLVGRLPVWTGGEGERRFWGVVSVTLKYPDALAGADLDGLRDQGFFYEIWRVNPDDNQRQTIAGSPHLDARRSCLERTIRLFNADWHFRIAPVYEWYYKPENWVLILGGLLTSVLAGSLVQHTAHLGQMKEKLERQERELRESAQTAQEANRMKSTFLANMSHEIRTPLNGIIGMTELAMGDAALPAATRRHLHKLRVSGVDLLGIVDNILDLAKIETGHIDVEQVPFELEEVFRHCEMLEKPKALAKNLTLHFHAPPLLGARLVGDPGKLRQVLINLVDNGVKFTNRGIVNVKAAAENHRPDAVDIRFEVRDSGIGITEEQLRRVFSAFVQGDGSVTRKYGGAGLGLAIAKDLIEAMGGTLSVTSTEGIGSSFSFTLPFATAPIEALPEPGFPSRRPLFSGDILVCEDNAINRDVITESLARAGFAVLAAPDGRAGVEMVRQRIEQGKPFDLIFMDIHMPEMGGVDAAKAIASLGVSTPIVALTANIMPQDRATYRAAGMADCLGKPFQSHELWALLQKYFKPSGFVPTEAGAAPSSPVPPADSGTRIIDRALGLERSAGNPELYNRLLKDFAGDNRHGVEDIRAALASGDVHLAHRKAHTLKGTALLIGAVPLANAALAVEKALENGEDRHDEEQLRLLQAELMRVLKELDACVEEVAAVPGATASLFERLIPLLQADDVDSLALEGEIRAILTPLSDRTEELIACLKEYDFGAALAIAEDIRAKNP